MRFSSRAFAALATLLSLIACGEKPTVPQTSARTAGWRSDLDFLISETARRHPPVSADPQLARFKAAIAGVQADIDRMTDEEIVIGMQRALAGVGDGHTSIIPIPTATLPFATLPVDFYWFDDGVFVVGGSGDGAALVGSRVLEVGGVAVESIIAKIGSIASSDNASSARWLGAQVMSYTAVLRAAGATVTDQAATTLRIVDPTGATRTASVTPGSRQPVGRLLPAGGETAATPRYLRRADKAFWLDSLVAQSVLYVGFNAVRDDPGETLAAFAAKVGASLQSGKYRSVVVETRLNNGGDNRLLAPLVTVLNDFSATSGRRLIVIVGRATFSAAQNFVNQLERSGRATFIGEPTGSRPNFPGDDSDIPLPYSKVHVAIASHYYQDSDVNDLRVAISPPIGVVVKATDYFANRDPGFDAALQAASITTQLRRSRGSRPPI